MGPLSHQAPLWAQALMRRVLDEHMPGADDAGEAPWLVWKRSKRVLSQGQLDLFESGASILTVWAGRRKLDQKLVLLHELARGDSIKRLLSVPFWRSRRRSRTWP